MPKQKPPLPRSRHLQIRATESEVERVKQLADKAGMSVSQLLRDHIGKITIRNRADERSRLIMLNRINANLNMIAKWANTQKGAGEAVEVVTALCSVERALLSLIERLED